MSHIRVLHLFSNWKLTGPAEPAVNLAAECSRAGSDVTFLCGRAPKGRESRLYDTADRAGVRVETPIALSKHLKPIRNWLDIRALSGFLGELKPCVIHCHMQNDTRIALGAVKKAANAPAIVRTVYEGTPGDIPPADLRMLRRVDNVIAVSRAVADHAGGIHIHTGIDQSRFDPAKAGNLREKWGISAKVPVIGVVARIQGRRRFDLIFEAFKRLLTSYPEAVLVIVGRGTRKREVAEIPIRDLGIQNNVVLAGYLRKQEYVDALSSLDVLTYLVPGTDGSCRTVREAMTMGVPVVSSRRGMLPELVKDGVTGVIAAEESTESLHEAMKRILSSAEKLSSMSRKAREESLECFSLSRQAKETSLFYEKVLGG